jgi:hypothetical protein
MGDALLASYLAAIGPRSDAVSAGKAELRCGQFHDVLLLREFAYRFPRDEQTRRLLPGRVALLRTLGNCELPVAIAEVMSDATFALQQALPAALSGDTPALDDGLLGYREQR